MDPPNPPFDTRTIPADAAGIAEAARLIGEGLPVAVPTETVYGLAADAGSGAAVARIYAAKGRPAFNPLIVHVADLAAAEQIARFDETARELARRHWPGPLTLVLPLRDGAPVAGLATAGLPTVAIRVPAHPAMRALLEATGRPLAAPSANRSGRISPTRAEHVRAGLGGRIPLILDGGPTGHGLESTIVATDGGRLRLLRPGPIPFPPPVNEGGAGGGSSAGRAGIRDSGVSAEPTHPRPLPSREGSVEAPGQLASHYAPARPLRLEAAERRKGEWLIGFGPVAGDATLSASGDLVEAAANLFERLHEADASGRAAIAVAPVPDDGLGAAINDRLRRAAAPRTR